MELLDGMYNGVGEGNISWFPDRMDLLQKIMINLNPTLLVEIGFNMGHSCKLMCDTLIKKYGNGVHRRIYCFDVCVREYAEPNFKIMKPFYEKFNIDLVFIKGDSAITLPEYLNSNNIVDIEFANIDGDHTYEGATRDFNNLKDRIKIGGLVYIDDYRAGQPGVDKAIDNFDWTSFRINSIPGVMYGTKI